MSKAVALVTLDPCIDRLDSLKKSTSTSTRQLPRTPMARPAGIDAGPEGPDSNAIETVPARTDGATYTFVMSALSLNTSSGNSTV